MSRLLAIELDNLAAEIVALSGLHVEVLNNAAIELSVGMDMHRRPGERSLGAILDPYDGFLAFAVDSGLDYTIVDGSDIGDLSTRQKYLAVAWHYVGVALFLCSDEALKHGWNAEQAGVCALWHKMAARKLVEDTVGRLPSRAIADPKS